MAVATFDTLKFANALKAAGVPAPQAEAQAAAFAEVIQANFKELATREDIAAVRAEIATLRADLERVETELRTEIGRAAETAKKDLEQAVQVLRQEMAILKQELIARFDTMAAKQGGEIYLLKWMFGATFTVVVATLWLVIRLSFARLP